MDEIKFTVPHSTQHINRLLDIHHDNWHLHWLEWLCSQLPNVSASLLVTDEAMTGQFHAMAILPADTTQDELLNDAAEVTLRQKKPIITPCNDGKHQLGSYPIFINDTLRSVVTLLFTVETEEELHHVLDVVEYCSGWLELRLGRNLLKSLSSQNQRQHVVIDSIAHVLGERNFEHAALQFVNLMGRHLKAGRVVLGFVKNSELVIHSQSDSSDHSKKHELVKLTTKAMQEAVDQQETILWPEENEQNKVSIAQNKLSDAEGQRALMTIPLVDKELCYGAILFDRPFEQPFSKEDVLTAEALANFVGVVLEEKRQSSLPLYSYISRSFKNQFSLLIGPGHLARKITVLSLLLVSLFLSFTQSSYNIAAEAIIEGAELRAIVVPLDSYLQAAQVRAGDSIEKGTLLVELDTRQSRLQRMSWMSQQATSRRQYEDALAKQELAQVQVSKAKMQRAQAEIELLDYEIAQATIVAPFDAFVVSGDLNQRIGSLVRQGEQLFELSPSNRYRLAIYIDQSRINDIKDNQMGRLVLAALPEEKFEFMVTRINPIAEVRDGATVYRVEAELTNKAEMLRVGLEGVAQVYVDERLLIDVWTRSLRDWTKLELWRFWG